MKPSMVSNRFIGYALTVGMMGAPVVAHASTVSTFDVLVATDNLTVIGTTTVQGNGFSVGNSTFVVQQGRIGIGTATLTQQFQMVGIQPYGSDDFTQLVWFSTRGALRAGGKILSFPDPWTTDRIGLYSAAFGLGNEARGDQTFVGGGALNVARAAYTVIGGGGNNLADGSYAVIAGGPQNDTTASAATVSGGFLNLAGNYASVGGGFLNIASAQYATIPGGRYNIASGTDSFAAGYNASAEGTGSFVWADAGGPQFRSTINNEFKARANGGFVLVGGAGATTVVSSGSFTLSTAPTAGSAMPNIYISSINGNVGIGKTAPATALDVNGAITASSATFTATGSSIYSLTSSSGIHIVAGGLTMSDNTVFYSTTQLGSSSSGEASLTSTQTFSGVNTFTGAVIFTNGACYRMDYSSFSAQTSVTFSGLSSSTTYRLVIRGFQNTSDGAWFARFNGDTGLNYKYSGSVIFDQGSPASFYSNGSTGIILVTTQSGNKAKAGTPVDGSFEFSSVWGLPKTTKIYKSAFEYTEQSVPADGSTISGGRYIGSAALSSILIATDAGTMTGYIELWNCGAWGLQN